MSTESERAAIDERRCRVCGWPLAKKFEDGCGIVYGGSGSRTDACSMRPLPERRADSPPDFFTDPAASRGLVEYLTTQSATVHTKFHRQLLVLEIERRPRTPPVPDALWWLGVSLESIALAADWATEE